MLGFQWGSVVHFIPLWCPSIKIQHSALKRIVVTGQSSLAFILLSCSICLEIDLSTSLQAFIFSTMTDVANFPVPAVEAFPGSKLLNGGHVSEIEFSMGTPVTGAQETLNGTHQEYKVKEQWHSQRRHLRVIHVGAGAAGLLMAYKMQRNFEDYSLVCYEK